ncbi:MAG TPA: 23S rRNA (guanosine(2251)-2'-O)-methyltransferase RlmB [Steroidobacteraceae bacterium]|nr:23S rRNA (guanosine(2251)-2'-O)-methyltransferase RlmB [Steroidobacteraceae bacterium]
MSEETVYGLHAVRALLERRPGAVRRVILQSGRTDRRATELAELARARSIVIETRPAAELDALAGGGVHQGAAARVEAALPLDEHELLMRLDGAARPPLVLVLDGVQDPHNLGACLRTADGAGADAVVAPRDRAVGLTPVVRKVAAGAAETVPFTQVTNLARFLRALKDAGLWVVGTDGEAQSLHYSADLKGPLAVVLGAEGGGMRRLTREHCDLVVRLPMLGGVESLNVSVAAGVMLYEAVRQRAAAAKA